MSASRRFRMVVLLGGLALVAVPEASAQGPSPSSAFAQLTGSAGCLRQPLPPGVGSRDCQLASGLAGAAAVEVSPDDRHVYVASLASDAVATFERHPATGALAWKGCISDDGGDGRTGTDGICANGDALLGAADLAMAPDGRHLYVAAGHSHGVTVLARDLTAGKLEQAACVKDVPRADRCSGTAGLVGASGVAVSPDGRHVYVTADQAGTLTTFDRDTGSGALSYAGCISNSGSDGRCVDGTGLEGANDVVVTADGRTLYVTAGSGAVTRYSRDPASGLPTQTGCLLEHAPAGGPCTDAIGLGGATAAAVSPDGRDVYVTGASGTVAVLRYEAGRIRQTGCLRHASAQRGDRVDEDEEEPVDDDLEDEDEDEVEGQPDRLAECNPAKALYAPAQIAVTSDGTAVLVAGGDSLASFARDRETGALTQTGCIENYRTYKSCLQGRAMGEVSGMGLSKDGRSVYLTSADEGNVSVFRATVSIGATATRARGSRDARVALACPRASLRSCRGTVRLLGTSSRLARPFALAPGRRTAVAVRLTARARRLLRRHPAVRLSVVARDSSRATMATGRRIVVRR